MTAGGSYHIIFYDPFESVAHLFVAHDLDAATKGKQNWKMVSFILERNQFVNGWVETWAYGTNSFRWRQSLALKGVDVKE